MRKFIITSLIAAVAMPVAIAPAAAQSRAELRRDRQDIREERRDLNRAYRSGDRGDIRDARGDLREARQEYREDRADRNRRWGNDDWRGWRNTNRNIYARGNWRAPFRYQSFRTGVRIGTPYYASRYWINDPWRYRLPPVRGYQRWVRHYNDVLLVDTRRGTVIRVLRDFYW
ncbi:MAG: RcnB family protein [Pseudomonadota bacterium]